MNILRIRLKSCLQAILDLEPQLRALDHDASIRADMLRLRRYLHQVDAMHLVEEDVHRLERVTESFMCELRVPLRRTADTAHTPDPPKVLQ